MLPILFVADEQNRGRKPRSGSGFGSPGSNGKRKATDFDVRPRDERAVTGFYCAKHGGNRAKHNTAECRSNIGKLNYGSLNNRPNRATSTATRSAAQVSSGADICFAWHKPRGLAHTCAEYPAAWKKESEATENINVHSVKTSVGSTSNLGPSLADTDNIVDADVTMEEIDRYLDDDPEDENEAEKSSLDCKSNMKNKHERFSPFQLLTPIIILESKDGIPVRLIAKVDTGSDFTLLNKNVLHHKLLFTSREDILPIEGNLNFLSNSTNKKGLGKPPAIKIRNLINDILFHH